MKTVTNTETVKIKITENELINGKWLSLQVLSGKLGETEKENNMSYKALRNRMYNSNACGKYNVAEVAGMKCIDVENPMKGTASLVLVFERG